MSEKDDSKIIEGELVSEFEDQNLPVLKKSGDLVGKDFRGKTDPLTSYLREISKYDLLTPEQEKELTEAFYETGDIDIAKQLVQANLRLVVKIAMEYNKAYSNLLDLIQEGNIGLMKAVSKYDPSKGAKLSYYASWWIRSYILKFILDNFRLVKIGTTKDQKKLFFNLMKEKERLEKLGVEVSSKKISKSLGVSEKAVIEMDKRLGPESGDLSIDKPIGEGGVNLQDILPSDQLDIDEVLADQQSLEILKSHLGEFLADLNERDRDIFSKRLLTEVPPSLQAIADEYGVSRERIRQIEERLLKSLREFMEEYLGN